MPTSAKTELLRIDVTGEKKSQKWSHWNFRDHGGGVWCWQRDIFEVGDSGRRGREQKLFKKRFRLDV